MSENYEVMEAVEEETVDAEPEKKKIFTKENIKKGLKILAIGAAAIGGVVFLGSIATPKELDAPEGESYDEGSNESDN